MSATLPPGTRLGRYEIRSQIGAGGMGEVFLAEDNQLRRQVALKILSADVTDELISRFVQEARAASALNHQNILTIHEIGEAGGLRYIASELVRGETLRDRLRRETPSCVESVEIAGQIAAALAAAHKIGIVHRDIKPENVMIREDGLVKVLDFGLAKLTQEKLGEGQPGRDRLPDALRFAAYYLLPYFLSLNWLLSIVWGWLASAKRR